MLKNGTSLLPEKPSIQPSRARVASVKPFNLPDGQSRPQEFTMAPAYGKPDLSCSRFVAMGSKKRAVAVARERPESRDSGR